MTLPFVLRAGQTARTQIQQHGFTADSLAAFGAPAGGPKFFIQAHLDRFAFRLLAAAHPDPAAAAERLYQAYCRQHYASKPTAADITREVNDILHTVLQVDDMDYILHHPWLQLNLLTTRCLGLAAARQPAWQAIGFALAYASNLRARHRLATRFERCVFQNHTQAAAVLAGDSFHTHTARLTRDNLAPVTLAGGTIPLLMETVRDIPHGPAGAHIDGGMVDCHMDLPLQ